MADGPPRRLEYTGERCVPWVDDRQVLYEHLHRYFWAARLVAGRRVVDLGSGEGYGTAVLAATASSAVGVDVDAASVDHARARYATVAEFRLGDVTDPGLLEAGAYDAVVCFEVLEHVEDQAALVAGVARALRPGGLFVVSTPDRPVYDAAVETDNPFHVRELDASEFDALVGAAFAHRAVLRQGMVLGSALVAVDPPDPAVVERLVVARQQAAPEWRLVDPPPAAPYLVMVASDRPLPPLPAVSILEHATPEAAATGRAREEALVVHNGQLRAEIDRLAAQLRQVERARHDATVARELAEQRLAQTRRSPGPPSGGVRGGPG